MNPISHCSRFSSDQFVIWSSTVKFNYSIDCASGIVFVEAMNASESSVELGAHLFNHVDYWVLGVLSLCSVAIGLYFGLFSNKEQTTAEYLHGGFQMQVVPIAISLVTRFKLPLKCRKWTDLSITGL